MAHRNLLCVLFVSLLVALPSISATPSLQGIAVAIRTPEGKVIRGSTDADGRFQFPIDAAGTYSLFFFPDSSSGAVSQDGTWYSLAGWPYQFSVETPAVQLSDASLAEERFDSQPVPVLRMNVPVGATAAPGTMLRGSLRFSTLTVTAPQPPKYAKVRVVKGDDVKGCKGDVWVSNGLGMWENNCARGQACCDLAARYDHKTRGAKKQ